MIKKYIEHQVQKALDAIGKSGSLIVGYDFDDTVFPLSEFAHTYYKEVQQVLRDLNSTGKCRFICITCREEPTKQLIEEYGYERMRVVERFLFENKIPYNAINQNLPWGLPDDPRKIYCNIMIDDKCGLPMSLEILKEIYRRLNVDNKK